MVEKNELGSTETFLNQADEYNKKVMAEDNKRYCRGILDLILDKIMPEKGDIKCEGTGSMERDEVLEDVDRGTTDGRGDEELQGGEGSEVGGEGLKGRWRSS